MADLSCRGEGRTPSIDVLEGYDIVLHLDPLCAGVISSST